jgi:hypothetical protein
MRNHRIAALAGISIALLITGITLAPTVVAAPFFAAGVVFCAMTIGIAIVTHLNHRLGQEGRR